MERIRLNKNGKIDKRHKNGGHSPAGAGRRFGSKNKLPVGLRGKAVEAHMGAGGIMPLDFMFACLRDNTVAGGEGKGKWKFPVSWEDKKWAADKLLHCFTPKLTDSKISGTIQVLALPPEALKGMTLEELAVMEKALGRMAAGQITGPANGAMNGNGHDAKVIDAEAYEVELGED